MADLVSILVLPGQGHPGSPLPLPPPWAGVGTSQGRNTTSGQLEQETGNPAFPGTPPLLRITVSQDAGVL